MVHNNKNNKIKNKKSVLFTKDERNKTITNMMMQLSMLDIAHVVTKDLMKEISDYIENGTTKEIDFSLKEYGRTLVIRLYNNKNMKTFMNLRVDGPTPQTKEIQSLNKRIQELKESGFKLNQ